MRDQRKRHKHRIDPKMASVEEHQLNRKSLFLRENHLLMMSAYHSAENRAVMKKVEKIL
jgi:hypothetical protein